MTEFRINDKMEALDVIRAAIWHLERDDMPYTYGAAIDPETGEQIVYFDLPLGLAVAVQHLDRGSGEA